MSSRNVVFIKLIWGIWDVAVLQLCCLKWYVPFVLCPRWFVHFVVYPGFAISYGTIFSVQSYGEFGVLQCCSCVVLGSLCLLHCHLGG